ncbi:MAG: carbohydrate porin [Planctomycetes bacterium]|nr:carbohydrate porin [Planctomycetota bacterium]
MTARSLGIALTMLLASPAFGQSEPEPAPAAPPPSAPKEKEKEPPPKPDEKKEPEEKEPEKPAAPTPESADDIDAALEEISETESPPAEDEKDDSKKQAEPVKPAAQPAKPPPESGDDIDAALDESGAKDEPAPAKPPDDAPPPDEKPAKPPIAESGEDVTAKLEESEKAEDLKETVEQEKTEPEKESGDNVTGQLEEVEKTEVVGLLPHGPVSELYQLWKPFRLKLRDETGLAIGMAYTTLLQVATSGDERAAMAGDFDIFGKWRPPGQGDVDAGALGFAVEDRQRFTTISPNSLNEQFGSLWRTTHAFNARDLSVVQLWWEQYLFEDHVRITAGKIDPANFYNGNRFQSQNVFFMNRAFSQNPARKFSRQSIGVNVRMVPAPDFYVSLGLHDANGKATTTGLNKLDADELFYAAEIGYTPDIEGLGPGRYRFTYWNMNGGDASSGESGYGYAFSMEQDLGNNVVPFFRYAYQDRELRDTKQFFAGGVGITNPFGRADDVLGIGAAWGQAEDKTLRDQTITEVFYRLQLTPKIQLTPGYQLIFDPSKTTDTDLVGVFQFRFRLVF